MGNTFLFLGFFLLLTTVSESRTITPRGMPKDGSSGHGEIPISLNPLEKDRRLGVSPGIWDQPAESHGVPKVDYEYEDANRQPSDYEYTKPAEGENEVDNKIPGIIPDEFPSDVDHDGGPVGIPGTNDDESVGGAHDVDKSYDDEEFHGEEDSDNTAGEEKDSWHPTDEEEDKSIHKDENEFHHGEDADEEKPDHSGDDRKEHMPVDKEEDDKDTGKHVPVDEEHVPDDEHEEKSDGHDKGEGDEKKDVSNDDEESDEHDKDDDDEKKDVPKDDEEPDEHDKSDDDEKKDEEAEDEAEESKDKDGESDEHDKEDEDEDEKDDDDKNVQDGKEPGFLNGSSIFDTPFFNLEQVKKYFGHLDRALGYVFRQTMEEGILLNGTYANTTEEEVEIDGKKYIVQKSLIKGPGNRSSIYVESLSSKSNLNNDTEGLEDTEVKNGTDT